MLLDDVCPSFIGQTNGHSVPGADVQCHPWIDGSLSHDSPSGKADSGALHCAISPDIAFAEGHTNRDRRHGYRLREVGADRKSSYDGTLARIVVPRPGGTAGNRASAGRVVIADVVGCRDAGRLPPGA